MMSKKMRINYSKILNKKIVKRRNNKLKSKTIQNVNKKIRVAILIFMMKLNNLSMV